MQANLTPLKCEDFRLYVKASYAISHARFKKLNCRLAHYNADAIWDALYYVCNHLYHHLYYRNYTHTHTYTVCSMWTGLGPDLSDMMTSHSKRPFYNEPDVEGEGEMPVQFHMLTKADLTFDYSTWPYSRWTHITYTITSGNPKRRKQCKDVMKAFTKIRKSDFSDPGLISSPMNDKMKNHVVVLHQWLWNFKERKYNLILPPCKCAVFKYICPPRVQDICLKSFIRVDIYTLIKI